MVKNAYDPLSSLICAKTAATSVIVLYIVLILRTLINADFGRKSDKLIKSNVPWYQQATRTARISMKPRSIFDGPITFRRGTAVRRVSGESPDLSGDNVIK